MNYSNYNREELTDLLESVLKELEARGMLKKSYCFWAQKILYSMRREILLEQAPSLGITKQRSKAKTLELAQAAKKAAQELHAETELAVERLTQE